KAQARIATVHYLWSAANPSPLTNHQSLARRHQLLRRDAGTVEIPRYSPAQDLPRPALLHNVVIVPIADRLRRDDFGHMGSTATLQTRELRRRVRLNDMHLV